MTDKVQKIREEVKKLKLCTMDEHMKFYSDAAEAEYNALCNIEHFIDSLQEEPVSEDLEEASRRYALNNTPWDDCADEMQEAFKAGAKWQKQQDQSTIELAEDHAMLAGMNKMEEQLMAKAIDAKIGSFTNGTIYDVDFNIDSNLKDDDKVKVIVIKED